MSATNTGFQHPRFSRFYDRLSRLSDRHGGDEQRARLLAGLTGRVIEIGVGNGLNFRHYPAAVTEVVAVEPEDHLRSLAEQAAASGAVPVRVVAGHAGALPVEDASADAAVFSLVLCSVTDPAAALAEAYRVLRPGGELRFYEHVRSARAAVAKAQDALAPATSRLFGGCRFNRDTAATIRAAGFTIADIERLSLGGISHIRGRAQPALRSTGGQGRSNDR